MDTFEIFLFGAIGLLMALFGVGFHFANKRSAERSVAVKLLVVDVEEYSDIDGDIFFKP